MHLPLIRVIRVRARRSRLAYEPRLNNPLQGIRLEQAKPLHVLVCAPSHVQSMLVRTLPVFQQIIKIKVNNTDQGGIEPPSQGANPRLAGKE